MFTAKIQANSLCFRTGFWLYVKSGSNLDDVKTLARYACFIQYCLSDSDAFLQWTKIDQLCTIYSEISLHLKPKCLKFAVKMMVCTFIFAVNTFQSHNSSFSPQKQASISVQALYSMNEPCLLPVLQHGCLLLSPALLQGLYRTKYQKFILSLTVITVLILKKGTCTLYVTFIFTLFLQ